MYACKLLPGLALVCACASSDAEQGKRAEPRADGDGDEQRWLKYIRGDQYARLELEVDAVTGLAPHSGASGPVLAVLERTVDKAGGVELRMDGDLPPRGTDHVWTFAELSALAASNFEDRSAAGSIAMHVLFVDGHYEKDDAQGTVLGVAWAHRHIVMFKDNLERSCNARSTLGLSEPSQCQRAEAAVWLHEVGHVLGLVDNGLPMVRNHRDPNPEHGRHDVDEACIMYWAYDGEAAVDAVLTNLLGGPGELAFCQTNLDDINAVK